jgi:hypothetical protein
LIVTVLVVFSWYTNWSPFAYFFQQESHQVSTATTVIHPTDSETERVIPSDEKTSEQAASPSAAEPATTTQEEQTSQETDGNATVEQDSAR